MTKTIAVIAAGAMGSVVGSRLSRHGARVLTSLDGRGKATQERAMTAGVVAASDAEIAASDIFLSIVPPAHAVAVAERFAPAIARSPSKPVYMDCNAINVATVGRVAHVITATGARFVDAAIIGPPGAPHEIGPTFYLSGEAPSDLEALQQLHVKVRSTGAPLGGASALKMAYAGINKGVIALAATMILAASRAGVAAALHSELAQSHHHLLARLSMALPDMYPKAYRFGFEMREVASFAGEDGAANRVFEAFADLYDRLAIDWTDGRAEIGAIDAFLGSNVG